MLKEQANDPHHSDNYEEILLDMFQSSGEIYDYMVLIVRFFISFWDCQLVGVIGGRWCQVVILRSNVVSILKFCLCFLITVL